MTDGTALIEALGANPAQAVLINTIRQVQPHGKNRLLLLLKAQRLQVDSLNRLILALMKHSSHFDVILMRTIKDLLLLQS